MDNNEYRRKLIARVEALRKEAGLPMLRFRERIGPVAWRHWETFVNANEEEASSHFLAERNQPHREPLRCWCRLITVQIHVTERIKYLCRMRMWEYATFPNQFQFAQFCANVASDCAERTFPMIECKDLSGKVVRSLSIFDDGNMVPKSPSTSRTAPTSMRVSGSI